MKTPLRSNRMVKTLATAAALALLASGCSSSSAGDSGGNVTVRFTWWGNDLRNKQTQQVIDAFQASHPNIRIQAEPGVWSSYWDKLATTTAANDSPDIIQMDQAYIAEYGGRGALLDLSKQGNIDTSKIDRDALTSGQVDGKQYGLSTGQNAKAVMINTKMFRDYGVPIPDDKTWTWDDYTTTAAQIAAAAAKAGQTNYGSSYSLTDSDLNTWAMQHGGSLYSADRGLGFTEDTATSFFQNVLNLRNRNAAPPANIATEDISAPVEQTLFATGKTAMSWWWTNQVNALQSALKTEVKILRAPSSTGSARDNGMSYKPSMFWSVSSRSKHPKEAAEVVNYLLNNLDAAKTILTERGFPTNSEVQAAIDPLLTPADKAAAAFLKDIKPDLKNVPPVPPTGSSGVQALIQRYCTDVLFDRKSPSDAAKGLIQEAQGMIDSARK
ncbi:ABC transporter substrate-binding protein [Pseudarthrobacter phenanthrenivorans]|uniref:ABC transporter substrate-binding protein n=1 Tax=Pseudarthrobacter phenanthrenivorans TaxID=361575 RepID=A0A0B4EFK9_PSEPS|nr:extracellular solute-binding protein [Pseudarthrobacter phenanthrenivorans]KIC65428.1 ABC transporter substrate-binding protein [Pseudarthrobacter phenanthrenivorans]